MKSQLQTVAASGHVENARVEYESFGNARVETRVTELDLVVPFTTPDLTRAAIAAASRMADGLHAAIRIVRVQCVPYPMELDQSPVFLDFLHQQMQSFRSPLPLSAEIRFSREFGQGLSGALHADSVIVFAFRRRPWRTRSERLAAALRKDGRKVIQVEK